MAYNFKQDTSNVRHIMIVAFLLILSVALITIYAREGTDGPLHRMQNTLGSATTPVRAVGGNLSALTEGAGMAASNITANPQTLSDLRAQNEEMRNTIAQLEEYRQEAQRLQGLLDLKDAYSIDGVAARVLSYSSDSWNQTVTINKGSADGIRSGLPVMGNSGLIGQVIVAYEHSAEVRLLIDARSGVAAYVQSNRAEGVVHGSYEGVLYLQNVDDDAEVKVGDMVLTSGLGGGYFRGITIGQVVRIEGAESGGQRRIVVKPNDTAQALAEVMVVKSMNTTAADTGDTSDTDQKTQSNQSGQDSQSSTSTGQANQSGQTSQSGQSGQSNQSGQSSQTNQSGEPAQTNQSSNQTTSTNQNQQTGATNQ